MRIPEPLFVLVNYVVRLLLRSPLHGLMSGSVLLISYTGRNSGKNYCTPVRYIRTEVGVRCFTSEHIQWWRNVAAQSQVTLLVAGVSNPYQASVLDADPELTRQLLIEFLAVYPQDATYHDIRLNPDGSLNDDDLAIVSKKSVVVEFQEI